MSDKKRNVPVLRFNGFSDAWEQRKLGDLGSVAMNRRIFKEETSDKGEIPFYKIGTFGGRANSYISREIFEDYKLKYPYPEKGDILISASGSIGRTVEYNGEEAYYQDSNIVWLKHDKQLDNLFLKQFYLIVKWSGIEGSAIKRLYNKNILETRIKVPSIDEQQKIGALFKLLDNIIALHQRKLDALKQMKKGFLQQLFLKKREKLPRMRFADFQEEWKQRKLEVLAVFSKGRGYTKSDLVEKGTPIILYGHLYTKYEIIINQVNTFVAMKDKSVISKGNEVIVPSSGETAKDISRASVIGTEGFILGGDLNIIKPKREINSIFLALTISNGIQQKEMIKLAQGKSIVHLHNSDLKQIKLFYPSLGEQQQIGDFFIQLDSIITLYQNKLDKLNTLKRTYLKNMFI